MNTLNSLETVAKHGRGSGALAQAWRGAAAALALASGPACWAQARPAGLDASALQIEADYRVVAARCGTPAFEKTFFMQSRNFVAMSNGHDKEAIARQESAIRSMRRNPLSLIGSQADCKVQGEEIKRVMAERSRGR